VDGICCYNMSETGSTRT